MDDDFLEKEFDFSKAVKNPYAKALNESRTVVLDDDVIEYFEDMSSKEKIPLQALINLYLSDCMKSHRQLKISWGE